MRRVALSLIMICTLALPAAAQIARSAELALLEAGVICAPESVGFRNAPGTITGRSHVIDQVPDFITNAQVVPAVIGVGFGVRVQGVPDFGASPVIITLTHPPMGDDGVRQQSFSSAISGAGASVAFFQFDHGYELVEGTWSFEARRDDQLLYRVIFNVVAPQDVPELADICNYRDLLS